MVKFGWRAQDRLAGMTRHSATDVADTVYVATDWHIESYVLCKSVSAAWFNRHQMEVARQWGGSANELTPRGRPNADRNLFQERMLRGHGRGVGQIVRDTHPQFGRPPLTFLRDPRLNQALSATG